MPFERLRKTYGQGFESIDAQTEQRTRYGPCDILVPPASCFNTFTSEVLNPFYLFQVFAMALWFYDGYWTYSLCILIVSSASIICELYETTVNTNQIR
jgi:cation-transporting ATPase 13A3/4/5